MVWEPSERAAPYSFHAHYFGQLHRYKGNERTPLEIRCPFVVVSISNIDSALCVNRSLLGVQAFF